MSWPVDPAALPARNLKIFQFSKLLTWSEDLLGATPVVTRSARLLHSQQFLVLLERHEVDGGVGDDPGQGGRVAAPEREQTFVAVAMAKPSQCISETVVSDFICLEKYF